MVEVSFMSLSYFIIRALEALSLLLISPLLSKQINIILLLKAYFIFIEKDYSLEKIFLRDLGFLSKSLFLNPFSALSIMIGFSYVFLSPWNWLHLPLNILNGSLRSTMKWTILNLRVLINLQLYYLFQNSSSSAVNIVQHREI